MLCAPVGVSDKWGEEMRPIDADALIAWIKGSQQMTSKMKCVIAKIETMPDAVSVAYGEWIVSYTSGIKQTECSACGKSFITYDVYGWNYCPWCGAKMDKRSE